MMPKEDDIIGILEALTLAVCTRTTWYEVNAYNERRDKPVEMVTAVLAAVAVRQGFDIAGMKR